MLNTVQKSLIIVVLLAVANSCAEEIETRKTVKKSAAIQIRNYVESRADEDSTSEPSATSEIDVAKETSTSVPTSSELPPSTTSKSATTTTTQPTSTSTRAPLTSTRSPSTTTQSPPTTTRLTTTVTEELTTEKLIETTTRLPTMSSTSESISSTSDSEISLTNLDNEDTLDESSNEQVSLPDIDDLLPFKDPPKRKVIYINQQQNGKLNVHLELNDVSLIVIPNQKDQNQLSLLNLLFKSAQKSKTRLDNEEKKKEEKINSVDHDDYSKYKDIFKPTDENYHLTNLGNMPFVESRAPYKVDISSTLGQQSQPAVEIMPNAQQSQFQPQSVRSPMMQLLRPIPYAISSGPWSGQLPANERIFKRSIDSRLHDNVPNDFDNYNEDELTESILNTLGNNEDDLNSYDARNDSEFILLGAVENCGPGRIRNSYQICVSVDDME